jgi:hypothetical protein
LLALSPIDMPANWLERVNRADDKQEPASLLRSLQRRRPFGQPEWQKEIAKQLGLESAYRPTSRPQSRRRSWIRSLGPEDVQVADIGPVPLSRSGCHV